MAYETRQGEGENAPRLTFTHPLTASVLYEALPPDQRLAWHARIAAGLTPAQGFPFHFHTGFAAAEPKASAAHLLRAARLALQAGNLHLSETCCQEALDRCGDLPKLRAYAHCLAIETLYYAGRTKEADDVATEALATVAVLPHAWQLALVTWALFLAVEQRAWPVAQARGVRLAALLRSRANTPLALAGANMQLRWTIVVPPSERSPAVPALSSAAIDAAHQSHWQGERQLPACNRSRVRNNDFGTRLIDCAKGREALPFLEEMLSRHRAERDWFGHLQTTLALAEAYRQAEGYAQAENAAQQGLQRARDGRQAKWVLHAHRLLAAIYYETEQYHEALGEYRQCLAVVSCMPITPESMTAKIHSLLWTGHSHKELKAWVPAATYFDAVLRLGPSAQDQAAAHIGLAEIARTHRDSAALDHHYREAMGLLVPLPAAVKAPYLKRLAELRREDHAVE